MGLNDDCRDSSARGARQMKEKNEASRAANDARSDGPGGRGMRIANRRFGTVIDRRRPARLADNPARRFSIKFRAGSRLAPGTERAARAGPANLELML